MKELFELFEEMINFEEEMKKDANLTAKAIDVNAAREAFQNYVENRFEQMQDSISSSSAWLEEIELMKRA